MEGNLSAVVDNVMATYCIGLDWADCFVQWFMLQVPQKVNRSVQSVTSMEMVPEWLLKPGTACFSDMCPAAS